MGSKNKTSTRRVNCATCEARLDHSRPGKEGNGDGGDELVEYVREKGSRAEAGSPKFAISAPGRLYQPKPPTWAIALSEPSPSSRAGALSLPTSPPSPAAARAAAR